MGNPTNYHNLTPKTHIIPSIPYQYQTPEAKGSRKSRFNYTVEEDRREGEVLQEQSIPHRPHKMKRSDAYGGFQSRGHSMEEPKGNEGHAFPGFDLTMRFQFSIPFESTLKQNQHCNYNHQLFMFLKAEHLH
ncbi:hypothetical protein AMTRI_Chr07g28350 [Amborella trichopoda]